MANSKRRLTVTLPDGTRAQRQTPTTQADRDCDLEAETDHYNQRDPDWGRPEALRPSPAPRIRRTQMALFQDGSDLPLFCAGLLLLDDPEVQPPPPADPEITL